MLQLRNETRFATHFTVLPDADGIDTLHVAIQGTFVLRPALDLAEEQLPFSAKDEFWGEPGESSLKVASEIHLGKPGTDVVLVGDAHAPGGRPAPRFDVSLRVGPCRKVVRVFGDRTWKPGGLPFARDGVSSPEPVATVPLVWERAFGGRCEGKGGAIEFEPRNPVGVGFAGSRRGKQLRDVALPNLEDPGALLETPEDRPAPACFGFVAPSWQPRLGWAGTYDDAWKRARAPFLPTDFDARFFHAAPADLVCEEGLRGGEPVEIENACSRGPVRFTLPVCEFATTVRLAGQVHDVPVKLETVRLEPEPGIAVLNWRATLPCDKQALRVEEIVVRTKRLELGGRSRS